MNKKIFLITLASIIVSVSFSPVFAGVYNSLEKVSAEEGYFDNTSEELSEEEQNLQELLAEKDKIEGETRKQSDLLELAEQLREKEITLLDEKFKKDKDQYQETNKCGFFCRIGKLITYPFRKIADLF